MLELFNELKEQGKVTEAVLVGRNLFNKNPDNLEVFCNYMDLLLMLAENLPAVEERKNFLNQASIALAFYEENAELTIAVIEGIKKYREKLSIIVNNLYEIERIREVEKYKKIENENTNKIKSLYSLKRKIMNVKSQNDFDEILKEISSIDSEINHDYLNEEQNQHYNQLNKECTECISEKMRELEYKKNISYNKRAVESFDLAFHKFKYNEGEYRNQTKLFGLVSNTLFAFDVSRLFNETLIYYNHVYSYIFSRLDDDGKFALTKFSIECERKQR